jgi:hypothetical protein
MVRLVSVLACLLLLVPSLGTAQAPPVKIGLILPYTGVLSVQGTDTTHGVELYLKKIGARAGGVRSRSSKRTPRPSPTSG